MQNGTLLKNAVTLASKNEEVRKELEVLAARRAGLNPSTVLDTAKNPASCLHKYFCWDDTEAAHRFREAQAYDLIRTVRVKVQTSDHRTVTVRAFFPVKPVRPDGTVDGGARGNYLPINSIISDAEATRQVIAQAKTELIAFTRKYDALAEVTDFQGVFDAIKKTVTGTPALSH